MNDKNISYEICGSNIIIKIPFKYTNYSNPNNKVTMITKGCVVTAITEDGKISKIDGVQDISYIDNDYPKRILNEIEQILDELLMKNFFLKDEIKKGEREWKKKRH